jgi:hypothetical protein
MLTTTNHAAGMNRLFADERSEFAAAASAFLAARERIELIKEQALEQLGGVPIHGFRTALGRFSASR